MENNVNYLQKCKDLQTRIGEINANNETTVLAIARTKLALKRLRLEYAILVERLENNTANISTPYVTSPELPVANLPKKRLTTKFKTKQKERDPNLPKRPTNSYLIFCEMEKDNLKQKLEKVSPGTPFDMSKALTEAWKNLSEEEKKPYIKLYEGDRERYTREIKVYNEKKDSEVGAGAGGVDASVAGTISASAAASASPGSTISAPAASADSSSLPKETLPSLPIKTAAAPSVSASQVGHNSILNNPTSNAFSTASTYPPTSTLKVEHTDPFTAPTSAASAASSSATNTVPVSVSPTSSPIVDHMPSS